MSEARKRILNMLAEGKITVEQSEELLAAMEADEKARGETSPGSGSPFGGPFGARFETLAGEIQKQVHKAVKGIQPQSQEIRSKLHDLGGWLSASVGRMMTDLQFPQPDVHDGVEVEFMVPAPSGWAACRIAEISNLHGSVRIREGDEFSLKVRGQISRAILGDQSPGSWFAANALAVRQERLCLGIDRSFAGKGFFELELFLPPRFELQLHTLSAAIEVYGPFPVASAEATSGNLRFTHALFDQSTIETVSADVLIEGGKAGLTLRTTSGDFAVNGVHLGRLTAQTVSGDISLTDVTLSESSRLELNTTSGDIAFRRPSGPISRLEARTRTGEHQVRLAGNVQPIDRHGTIVETGREGAEIRAESVSGNILVD